MLTRREVLALFAAVASSSVAAQMSDDPSTARIWAGDPPGAPTPLPLEQLINQNSDDAHPDRILSHVASPRLTVFRPAVPTGTAILIAPGGGYTHIAVDKEGVEVGEWLATRGITVFVLTYRLPTDRWANSAFVAASDAQRALRYIRAHAAEYGISSNRVGLMGFSAGGHVAATVLAQAEEGLYSPVDVVDQKPITPNFAALLYPVIDLSGSLAHPGSKQALLSSGQLSVAELEDRCSPNRHITSQPPPTFICSAEDDESVPIANSHLIETALRSAGGRVEAHYYQRGGHGFGLKRTNGYPVQNWPQAFLQWYDRIIDIQSASA